MGRLGEFCVYKDFLILTKIQWDGRENDGEYIFIRAI